MQLYMDLDVVPSLEGEHKRSHFDKKVKSVIAFFLRCSDVYVAREEPASPSLELQGSLAGHTLLKEI